MPSTHRFPGVVCGRRICSDKNHLGPRWIHITEFYVHKKDADGNPLSFQSSCKACVRVRQRIYKGIQRRGRPYEQQSRMSAEERLRRKRQRYYDLKKDPEWLERRREYQRIYAEVQRRKAGVPIRSIIFENRVVKIEPGGHVSGERLDIEPFAGWLRERISVHGTIQRFAGIVGVDEKRVRVFLTGAQRHVGSATVDHWVTIEGSSHLWELYPELYADAA